MRKLNTAFQKYFFISLSFICINLLFFYFAFVAQSNSSNNVNKLLDKVLLIQNSLNSIFERKESKNLDTFERFDLFCDYVIYSDKLKVVKKSKRPIKAPLKVLNKFIQSKQHYLYKWNKEKQEMTFYYSAKNSDFFAVFTIYNYDLEPFLLSNYLIVIFIFLLFNILFFIFIFRNFIKPLKAVKYHLFELQSENYNVRLNLKENQEFHEISKSFNQIAKSFEKTIHYLEEKNDINSMELEIAREIQQIIYPKPLETPQFATYIYHNSVAEISGDYHDIFKLPDHSHGFLIVDVSGHGIPAALLTMMVKEKFRYYAPRFELPSDLFTKVNQDISALLEDFPFFFTAFYLKLDSDNRVFYTNAGNPHAILFSETYLNILEVESLAMGVDEVYSYMYQTHQTQLKAEDKILLYSDAVLELVNKKGKAFGMKRLCECLKRFSHKSGDEILSLLKKELISFSGGNLENLSDDLTLFLIEIKS